MQFDYDETTDSLYVTLMSGASVESEEIAEDIIADYDPDGKIIGLDIQHAGKHIDLSSVILRGLSPDLDVKRRL